MPLTGASFRAGMPLALMGREVPVSRGPGALRSNLPLDVRAEVHLGRAEDESHCVFKTLNGPLNFKRLRDLGLLSYGASRPRG